MRRIAPSTVFTIGHSTHSIGKFIGLLKAHGIEMLSDIRIIPRSQHNPQFNDNALKEALAAEHIDYVAMKNLGGLRHSHKDSPNTGWRNGGFRGYADYMQTSEFEQALDELIALSKKRRTAIMCAESLPWRCHRSLVADALTVQRITVMHIMPENTLSLHHLTDFARIDGNRITYPAPKDLFSHSDLALAEEEK